MHPDLSTHWPAEWTAHDATWLAWPCNADTWPKNLHAAQTEFVAFIRAIAEVEPVRLLCGGTAMQSAKEMAGSIRNVELIDIPTNDAWIRDWGPTFVFRNQQLTAIDWRYDAWGGKYPPFEDDAANALRIAARIHVPAIQVDRVIEGGALETNGQGVLLTTKSCLLNANRSGPHAQAAIESSLVELLGLRQVCWLSGGDIVGDDTDGHIDQIARFVNESTIVVSAEPDANDENYRTLKLVRKELEAFDQQAGAKFEIVELPSPGKVELNGVRLPASYANFYFASEIVIVPQFDVSSDKNALAIFKSLMPKRRIVGLSSRHLSAGLGSFHCLSQQQPEM